MFNENKCGKKNQMKRKTKIKSIEVSIEKNDSISIENGVKYTIDSGACLTLIHLQSMYRMDGIITKRTNERPNKLNFGRFDFQGKLNSCEA